MPSKRQQNKVNRWVEKWRKRLLLDQWTIKIIFMEEPHETDTVDACTNASALPLHQYTHLEIAIYPNFWIESEEEQEHTLVHELVHAITWRTKALLLRRVMKRRVTEHEVEDANELLTTHIARILQEAYR